MIVSLDDLLSYGQDSDRPLSERPWPDLVAMAVRAVVVSAIIAGALYVVGRWILSLDVPYALEFAVVLAFVLGRQIARALKSAPTVSEPIREQAELPAYGFVDRPFGDVKRWEDRLDWTKGDLEHFQRTVLPAINSIADERLRQKYGVSRAEEPDRAREIIGSRLCDFLDAETLRRSPSPRELSAIVAELEKL